MSFALQSISKCFGQSDECNVEQEINQLSISSRNVSFSQLKNAGNAKIDPINFDKEKKMKAVCLGLQTATVFGDILNVPPRIINFCKSTLLAMQLFGQILKIPVQVTKAVNVLQPFVNTFRWIPIVGGIAAGLEGCGLIAATLSHTSTQSLKRKVEAVAQQAYFGELEKILMDPNSNRLCGVVGNKDLMIELLKAKVKNVLKDLHESDHDARKKMIAQFQNEIGCIGSIESGIIETLRTAADAAHDIAYIECVSKMKSSLIKDHFRVNGRHLKAALAKIPKSSARRNAKAVKNLKLALADKITSDRLSILSGCVSGVVAGVFLAIAAAASSPVGYVISGVAIAIFIGKKIFDIKDQRSFERAMDMPVTPVVECLFHLEETWQKIKKLAKKIISSTYSLEKKIEVYAQQAYFKELLKILADSNSNGLSESTANKALIPELTAKVKKVLKNLEESSHDEWDKIIAEFQEEIGCIGYTESNIIDKLKILADAAHDIAYIEYIHQMKSSLIRDHFRVNGRQLKNALTAIPKDSSSKNAKAVKNLKLCLKDKITSDQLSILSGCVSGVAAIASTLGPVGYVIAGVAILIFSSKKVVDVKDQRNFEKAMNMPVTPIVECLFHMEETCQKVKKFSAKFIKFCNA